MEAVVNIIQALGVNQTIWVQLGLFFVSYLFLSRIVLEPYYKAFSEREAKTVGGRERAEKVYAQTRELENLFQRKARALNSELKEIFDKAKVQAQTEQEKINEEARNRAKESISKAKEKIQDEVNRAREDLLKYAPEISQAISVNLLSRKTYK